MVQCFPGHWRLTQAGGRYPEIRHQQGTRKPIKNMSQLKVVTEATNFVAQHLRYLTAGDINDRGWGCHGILALSRHPPTMSVADVACPELDESSNATSSNEARDWSCQRNGRNGVIDASASASWGELAHGLSGLGLPTRAVIVDCNGTRPAERRMGLTRWHRVMAFWLRGRCWVLIAYLCIVVS